MTPVTIRSLIAQYPALFYPQTWYEGESFMDRPLAGEIVPPVGRIDARHDDGELWVWRGWSTIGTDALMPRFESPVLVPAVALVAAYVRDPFLAVWSDYLWTDDTDRHGQRIYIGGTANGHGFEIHRHLHLTKRWGVPVW